MAFVRFFMASRSARALAVSCLVCFAGLALTGCEDRAPMLPTTGNTISESNNDASASMPATAHKRPNLGVEAENANERLNEARCEKEASCPDYVQVDLEACKQSGPCNDVPELHIPVAAFEACLDAIRKASCADYNSLPGLAACEGIDRARFSPVGEFVQLGSACTRDGDCPSGARCDMSETVCGACVACASGDCRSNSPKVTAAKVGDACKGEDSCWRGRDTVYLAALACVDGKCAYPPHAGEHCSVECDEGSFCKNSTCVAYPSVGEACTDRCGDGTQCVNKQCMRIAWCEPLSVGAPCDRLVYCGPGLTCDLQTNQCAELPRAGDSCLGEFPCWQSFCDYDDSTCKPLLSAGQRCARDEQCESRQCQDNGKCAPKAWCDYAFAPR